MKSAVQLALFIVLAGLIGLLSVRYIVNSEGGALAHKTGPWVTWPAAGAREADPYTRTRFLSQGRLPLSTFEAVEFEAFEDDLGKPLRTDCSYLVTGRMPATRWWSLTVVPEHVDPTPETFAIQAVASHTIVYEPDNTVRIHLARTAQPGNWLKLDEPGEFSLILRLYEPVSSPGGGRYPGALFSIAREACR